MSAIVERDELAARLDKGWQLIADAERAGRDVSAWEQRWLDLLARYEQLCREDAGDIAHSGQPHKERSA